MGLGGGGSAAKQAAKVEAQRQADIVAGTQRVNDVYDSPDRKSQQQQFLDAMRGELRQGVDRQKGVADRKLKFSNARAGLYGGSQDRDSQQTLGEDYQKGILDSERRAQGSFADLLGSDEQSRLSLIQLVQGGLDTGTAAQRAGASLQGNLQKAQANGAANGTWDVFANTANIWKTQTEQAEKRKAQQTPIGSPYSNPWS